MRTAACLLVVGLCTAACFLPALSGQFLTWDDLAEVTEPHTQAITRDNIRWMLTTRTLGHFRPLTWLSYALDHAIWGLDPLGYHLTSLLLHVANSLLVFVLLRSLLGRNEELLAAACALLFSIHPLRVEAVAWVAARKDLLCAFFLLLSLLCYLKRHGSQSHRILWLVGSLACYALSLAAKATGITFPALLLLLDLGWLKRTSLRAALIEKIPYLALALPLAAIAAAGMSGAMLETHVLSVGHRLLTAAYGLCFYCWKSLIPTGLSPMYRLDLAGPGAADYLCAGVVIGAVLALLGLIRRAPAVPLAFACYALLLLPVLGLTQVGYQKVADRYCYLACLPLIALLGSGLTRLPRKTAGAMLLVWLCLLGPLTWRQTGFWHDTVTLWTRAIEIDPQGWSYNYRGTAYLVSGDPTRALADFETAVRLAPETPRPWSSRGLARMQLGNPRGALADLDRSLALAPDDPHVLLERATAHYALGNSRAAGADLDRSIQLDPNNPRTYLNRATLRAAAADRAGALRDLGEALRLHPAYLNALADRAELRRRLGDLTGARQDLLRALSLAADPHKPALRQQLDRLGAR